MLSDMTSYTGLAVNLTLQVYTKLKIREDFSEVGENKQLLIVIIRQCIFYIYTFLFQNQFHVA